MFIFYNLGNLPILNDRAFQTDTGNCLNNSCLQPVTQRLSMDGGSGSARPGDPCDVNIKCIGGSTCLIGTCACEQGYMPR